MFDVWSSQEDPMLRLVLPPGGPVPESLMLRDWSLLGEGEVPPDVAERVRAQGFSLVRSNAPFSPGSLMPVAPGEDLTPEGVGLKPSDPEPQ